MATRVIIVRHGQSSYNALKMIQGRCDESVLTEKGTADAHQVGAALSSLRFDAVYSSPLQRAKKTAEVILPYLPGSPELLTPTGLLEIDLPLWEKLQKEAVKDKFSEEYRCWKERPHEFCMTLPNSEGTKEHFPVLALYEQAKQFWQEILPRHPGGTILIVAHNGINRCLLASALGISPALYHSIQQSNCGINVLNFVGGWGELVQLESLNQTSHMGDALPTPREGNRGLRLLLVRHGETEWNRVARFQGGIDVPLNDNGRKQAQQAAEFLKDVPIDFAVSSPMLRPKETAELILKNHPNINLELQEKLKEINHGLWEGKLESEIKQEYADLLHQWQTAPETVQMPEGENLQQVWDRAIACWNGIIEAAGVSNTELKTGLIVAHDAINKVILCHVLGLSPASIWSIKQGNGAVTVIDYPHGLEKPPILQAMNITTHLSGGVLDQTAAGAL
ncbi:histidine phosphatase family protein [Allocoleopsis franciscana]|uniref:Fructose-2,6-bisphosphatase n=1 Tax=Allocoleopsis franciscana PCC 7113 TaxID=1173027 RepID=K9WLA6_9CYAN|nr:histidine phosphatase family protein [Allocoleopsis franciscana]AFZ21185.1 fructose-2,6-bisphosphatase [Allocoleopsis franciscana PCC 7113]